MPKYRIEKIPDGVIIEIGTEGAVFDQTELAFFILLLIKEWCIES